MTGNGEWSIRKLSNDCNMEEPKSHKVKDHSIAWPAHAGFRSEWLLSKEEMMKDSCRSEHIGEPAGHDFQVKEQGE
jgi:hypothetical protein